METNLSTKIIVSNKQALGSLYGDGFSLIEEALKKLIESDKSRGINTTIFYIDDADTMTSINGTAVTDATDNEQNKTAIDSIYNKYKPDYLMILGAPDIIPHQELTNPMADYDSTTIPSDIPYACNSPYSIDPNTFTSPTRVIGRLPGVTGDKNANNFAIVINAASNSVPQSAEKFQDYFAASAARWEGTSESIIKSIFNHDDSLSKRIKLFTITRTSNSCLHTIFCNGSTSYHNIFFR